ncbi:MAG: HNH endonuclease [Thermodesulfovibrionia bacterium]|nr:HNH endonuclease [Thermodesulfovibrionia bacterium]
MKYWIGVTDNNWFNFLSEKLPDEVNFWQPSGRSAFRALNPGELFLFKLHYPLNYIVGGGFFVRHSILPLSIAWEAFEQKNGAGSFDEFRQKIMHFRRQHGGVEPDPSIGCIILATPFFLRKEEWLPVPSNWSSNIVQGKTYNAKDPYGQQLWQHIQDYLKSRNKEVIINKEVNIVAEDQVSYGAEYLTRARLGQGAFRILVTEAYGRKCAITGERTLPVLESAHIKPYSRSGPHSTMNGILLRSDLHKLFDLGYLTVTEDYNVEVSKRIKKEYENGREYYAFHGKKLINIPSNPLDLPSRQYIEWHNKEIYVP